MVLTYLSCDQLRSKSSGGSRITLTGFVADMTYQGPQLVEQKPARERGEAGVAMLGAMEDGVCDLWSGNFRVGCCLSRLQ